MTPTSRLRCPPLTQHALQRQRERRIPDFAVFAAVHFGRTIPRRDQTTAHVLEAEAIQWIEALFTLWGQKHDLSEWSGLHVIVSQDSGMIVTMFVRRRAPRLTGGR